MMYNYFLRIIFITIFIVSCKSTDHKETTNSLSKEDFYSLTTSPFPPCNVDEIPHYTAHKVESIISVDGKLDEPIWMNALQSDDFRDLISGSKTMYSTKVSILWDDEFLYVGYWIEEPNLQASLTEQDAYIYLDNDIELFIAGLDAYYELEINAFGTIYEVLFIWEESYSTKGFRHIETFDQTRDSVKQFNGVGLKNHPRGARIGYWNWDLNGLKSEVQLHGTINDSSDLDVGWTAEIAIPWKSLNVLTIGNDLKLPPKDQDSMRMDFSRFNQYKEPPPAEDSGGWAWSPHGVWDSHVPECFTFIHFTENILSEK